MALRTGGELNVINEKYRCNDPERTVRTSALVTKHHPATEQDMLQLLQAHETKCSACGEQCKNNGLSMWAQQLFHAVLAEQKLGNYKARSLTLQDCHAFMYDLFVKAPVRGFAWELSAQKDFMRCGYNFRHATPVEDCTYAVDLVHNQSGVGIQVKPESYKYAKPGVHRINEQKNAKYGNKVFYLYYQHNAWTNFEDVLHQLHMAIKPQQLI
jgi:hypothetical protein